MRMETSNLTDDRLEGDERGSEMGWCFFLRADPRVSLTFRANRGQAPSYILTVFAIQVWEGLAPGAISQTPQPSMQPLTAHQLGQFRRIRPLNHALLSHNHINQVGRSHIKYRVKRINL